MLQSLVILSIDSLITVDSPQGRYVEMQNRSSFGISLCYGGQITYTQGAHTAVSDREHLILLPKGKSYSLYGNSSGAFPVINIQCAPPFSLDAPTALRIRNPEVYLKDYEKLRELFFFQKDNAKCMSILYNMLSQATRDSVAENRVVAAVTAYINQHFCDPDLSNAAICQATGFSEAYFRRQFQTLYKSTPKQYIRELRLAKARQLLSETHLGIQEIAEQCGYASVYDFSRAFRAAQGLSATAYRASAYQSSI